jgi:5-keto 4-deoxyuronate isomerase
MKTAKGELKVQFFSNLALIRRRYEEGAVVAKLLHKELIETGKISMSYQSFSIYFRREIVGKMAPKKERKTITSKISNEVISDQSLERKSIEIDQNSPIIIRIGADVQKKFNPHAVEIDSKNKW